MTTEEECSQDRWTEEIKMRSMLEKLRTKPRIKARTAKKTFLLHSARRLVRKTDSLTADIFFLGVIRYNSFPKCRFEEAASEWLHFAIIAAQIKGWDFYSVCSGES
jgi:hypothetical protein